MKDIDKKSSQPIVCQSVRLKSVLANKIVADGNLIGPLLDIVFVFYFQLRK